MQNILSIGLEEAKAVATAARKRADADGWTVVIAIVDAGGHLILLECADGTQRGSIQVAQDKAKTALMFKRPTKALEDVVLSGQFHMANLTGAIPIEGGLPLFLDNAIVGAIGVSGVLSFQDGIIAQSGVEAFGR